MKSILVDTCFWFALLGTRQAELKPIAERIFNRVKLNQDTLIIPFPTLYETVNTKLLREKNQTAADWFLAQLNSNPLFLKVYDDVYRDDAFAMTCSNRNRGISLVDNILRVMMEDDSLRIDALITFNARDFVDVCTRREIILIDQTISL